MISLYFEKGSEKLLVNINNKRITFGRPQKSQMFAFVPVKHEKLNKEEFEQKISEMKSEEEIKDYIKEDLKQYGYVCLSSQKMGFRTIKEG